MIKKILNYYISKGGTNLVITSDAALLLDSVLEEKKEFRIDIIDDARSATFFALGCINVNQKPVTLITTSDELGSTLTGATEANYQNLPLIIIAVGNNSAGHFNFECFKHVTKHVIQTDLSLDDLFGKLDEYYEGSWYKPILIQLTNDTIPVCCNENAEYNDIVRKIVGICGSHSKIYIEHELDEKLTEEVKHKGLSICVRKRQYGAVSTFFGHAAATDSTCYMITSYEKISRDINAFNMQHAKNNVVIVYIKPMGEQKKLDLWFTNNNFQFIRISSFLELQQAIKYVYTTGVVIEFMINGGR